MIATDISRSLDRIALYLQRVRFDLDRGDHIQALADLAELGEISRRLATLLPQDQPAHPAFDQRKLIADVAYG